MNIYITGLGSGSEVEHPVRLFYPMAPLTLTPPKDGADCVWAEKQMCIRDRPYICHPLAVARLVLDLGMDSESIAAALLHDVVEDTPTTLTDLTAAFGEEVAALVDGVTKLTKIQFSNIEELQAENLRKMLLAMSRDVRVMIIKLCAEIPLTCAPTPVFRLALTLSK